MSGLSLLRNQWQHSVWADAELRHALLALQAPPAEAVRESAHILGAAEVWLSRLEHRASTLAVWPELGVDQFAGTAERVAAGYAAYFATLREGDLERTVAYIDSIGRSFQSAVGDILSHVVLHGQYHRGKVNLLLRQAGAEPAPVDFIAFVRGVPAARTPVPR